MPSIKFVDGSETEIEGLGMPWGGPHNGRDLDGEKFTKSTDFCFDWFQEDARPLLYNHGLDADSGASVVGRIKSYETKADLGVWTRAQLDASSEYFEAIKELVKQGKLFFSSGAMGHLVDVDKKSGEIKRWPWVELSLTPTPSNLFAQLDFATADKHFKSAGLELPDAVKPEAKAMDMSMIGQMCPHTCCVMCDQQECTTRLECCQACMECCREMCEECEQACKMSCCAMCQAHCQTLCAACCKDGCTMHKAAAGQQMAQGMGKNADLIKLLLSDDPTEITNTLKALPLVAHGETITNLAASLGERTKDLTQRRTKEGRTLSGANRQRLQTCVESMGAAMTDLQALLDATEPAKAVNVERLRLKVKLMELSIN